MLIGRTKSAALSQETQQSRNWAPPIVDSTSQVGVRSGHNEGVYQVALVSAARDINPLLLVGQRAYFQQEYSLVYSTAHPAP